MGVILFFRLCEILPFVGVTEVVIFSWSITRTRSQTENTAHHLIQGRKWGHASWHVRVRPARYLEHMVWWSPAFGKKYRCRLDIVYFSFHPETPAIMAGLGLAASKSPCFFASSLFINSILSLSNPFHPISSPSCHSFFRSFR